VVKVSPRKMNQRLGEWYHFTVIWGDLMTRRKQSGAIRRYGHHCHRWRRKPMIELKSRSLLDIIKTTIS
jgi:hypothetical protein